MTAFGAAHPSACPCGSGAAYAACCRPLLRAERLAQTAEELMRSRYTAYAVGDVAHLERTWHARHRPAAIDLDDTVWTGLDVVATEGGGPDDTDAVVELRARWSAGSRSGELHEVSRFARRGGRWVYVDGEVDGAVDGGRRV